MIGEWTSKGLVNDISAFTLECLIQTKTLPITSIKKWQVLVKLQALEQAVIDASIMAE